MPVSRDQGDGSEAVREVTVHDGPILVMNLDREEVARIIDPVAVDWKQPWRHAAGFYADDHGPQRWDAIRRDEDNERQNIYRRRVSAFFRADQIIALGGGSALAESALTVHAASPDRPAPLEEVRELSAWAYDFASDPAAPTNATWEQYARSRLKWLAGKLDAIAAAPAPQAPDADPTREVALIALGGWHYPNDALREVIAYAFDQLCWSLNDRELLELIDGLKAKITEDAPS